MMLHALERRAYLAVTTDLTAGLLTVFGTSGVDDIHIDVLQNGVTVKDKGNVIFSTPLNSLDVFAGILVNAKSGADTVFVNSNEAGFITTVCGQSGNDELTILSFHGKGGVVYGGPGSDTIVTDTEITGSGVGAQIYGNAGDDKITSTSGAGGSGSSIDGGAGDDDITVISQQLAASGNTVHGSSGDDVIRGGDLADNLFGGPGKDHLYGNGGDDALDGGAGRDFVDGGAGKDSAINSRFDSYANIETLVK
jgi:Ca2+-binding RTX toxin-like protein